MTDLLTETEAPPANRRRRRLRIGFIVLTVISSLILVCVGGFAYYTNHAVDTLKNVGRQEQVQAQTRSNQGKSTLPGGVTVPKGKGALVQRPKPGQPFTILILGVDSREGTGTKYGTNADACHCSDTIILARVNPVTDKVSLLSVPRDTRVKIAGTDVLTKINAAYGKGPDTTVQTIEDSLHIPINHWLVLDLAGFKGIVDAIGGIKMDFPVPVQDKNAGLYVTAAGCQKVSGDTALAISRSRELRYLDPKTGRYVYDPTFEYGRARREQIMMKVIAAHTVKRSLSNPFTAKKVIDTFTSNQRLGLDSQVDSNELLTLARDFAGFNAATIDSFSLPTFTSKIYDSGAGKKLDFEILQPTQDVATIQAWYNASLATPKATHPTSPPASVTTPPTQGSAPTSVGGTPTNLPTTAPTTAGAGAGAPVAGGTAPTTAAAPTVPPNDPLAWDPRPCTS